MKNDEIFKCSSTLMIKFHTWFMFGWPFTHLKIEVSMFPRKRRCFRFHHDLTLNPLILIHQTPLTLGSRLFLHLKGCHWFFMSLAFWFGAGSLAAVFLPSLKISNFCLDAFLSFRSTEMPFFLSHPLEFST